MIPRDKLYAIILMIESCLAINARISHAQPAAAKAAADSLFKQGKERWDAGEIAGACALFEASVNNFVQLGAQLALASCYEKLGKTASAWAEFHAAAATALKKHDTTRQRFAEERAADLELRLAKLLIKVEPGYRVDGLEVKRDAAVVSNAELGAAIAVDPGEHVIEASAPGWQNWKKTVSIVSPGVVEVIVPALGKMPVPEPSEDHKAVPSAGIPAVVASQRPEPDALAHHANELESNSESPRAPRVLAYSLAGGGIALVAISLAAGAVARARWNDAQPHCHDKQCDPTGVDIAQSAHSMGNISTGLFLVGAAAMTTGLYLVVTAGSRSGEKTPHAQALRIAPHADTTRVGISLEGAF